MELIPRRTLRPYTQRIVASMALFCFLAQFTHGDMDLMLNGSQWTIHAEPTAESKKIGAAAFDERFLFQNGVFESVVLLKQGFKPASYHSGGIETFLKWDAEQTNMSGDKLNWDGIADRQKPNAWKIHGSIFQTLSNGRVYKYMFKGKGEKLSTTQ